MFRVLFSWFRKPDAKNEASHPAPKKCDGANVRKDPIAVSGRLKHKKIYTFGVTPNGQHSTKCPVCLEARRHVFSIAVDELGQLHRCCLRCLAKLGGDEQIQLATKRSCYARRVVDCMEALDQLRREFPDPSRRPYGEKSLLAEIELPFAGYEGIERVLAKIKARSWTEYDRARIEGRPEPQRRNDY
jgi:hypothetical protein